MRLGNFACVRVRARLHVHVPHGGRQGRASTAGGTAPALIGNVWNLFRTKHEQQHLEGRIVWVLVGGKGRPKLKNTRSPAILLRETNRNTRWRCRKPRVKPTFWSSGQWEREKWAQKREHSRFNMRGWEGGDGTEKRPEEKAQLYSAVKQPTSTSQHKNLSISYKACLKKLQQWPCAVHLNLNLGNIQQKQQTFQLF